jgi:S-DNA-T family DNA segregation ATPase FtsK/SpoIIIE
MFADAGREVIASNMGSASLLQRKFNIGYPRAGKLIDQLEAAGVVGAASGAGKPRPVLMDLYAFENLLEQS